MRTRVLVVDDDKTLQTLTRLSLRDFEVTQAENIAEAREACRNGTFHSILIDISLPDGDGLRLLGDLKTQEETKNIPVIMLSGKTEIQNKVMAFSIGADDFISKPFDPLELFARVNSKISKARQESASLQQKILGNLMIDLDRQGAYLLKNGGESNLSLTATEFKILVLLTQRLEQVFSREQILERVWGLTHISDRTVDSHIAHLRTKLKVTSVSIDTLKNIGFRALQR